MIVVIIVSPPAAEAGRKTRKIWVGRRFVGVGSAEASGTGEMQMVFEVGESVRSAML